jgi:hypothetical protein
LPAGLQESRLGIVPAREEERHRLRRDLHDGHGPALTGIALKAGTVAGAAARTASFRPPRCLPRLGRAPGTRTGTGCMHAQLGPGRQVTRSPRNQALPPAITGAVTDRCPPRVADPVRTMPIAQNWSCAVRLRGCSGARPDPRLLDRIGAPVRPVRVCPLGLGHQRCDYGK